MFSKSVKLTFLDNAVALITIDVPESKVNTLSTDSMTGLAAALDEIAANKAVKGLIIASGKADNFIVGADVNEIKAIQEKSPIYAYEAAQLGKAVFAKIEKLPFPTVAAINGMCLGGGAELTLACSYRVANMQAKIGFPEVKLGLIPGWGGCVRLPKIIGLRQALASVMGATVADAQKALRIKLVTEVVADNMLLARAKEIAAGSKPAQRPFSFKNIIAAYVLEKNPLGQKIMANMAYQAMFRQTKGRYPAPAEALKVIVRGLNLPCEKAYELESRAFAKLAASSISRNLIGLFFAQQASKKQYASGDGTVKNVAVLGAGVMGAGIACAAARSGYKVVLKDINEDLLEQGKQAIAKLVADFVKRRKLSQAGADQLVGNIVMTTSYEELKDCDLVIEAIVEDMEVKQRVLKEVEKSAPDNFVFASNTSSLSITKIGEAARSPERVVGLHFFNPVHRMPLVEIIKGERSNIESLTLANAFALRLDKTVIVARDAPGFVVNRILAPYLREAVLLVEEGVMPPFVDQAMKTFGMPVGPLALLDEIGLDIAAKVIEVLSAELGNRFSAPKVLEKVKEMKLLGKKGGKGIYLYDEKGKAIDFNPEVLVEAREPSAVSSTSSVTYRYIQDRLILLMLNEAARCLEEEVVTDPAQIDLALIYGIGFPPYLGGIFKYADSMGIEVAFQKLAYLARIQGANFQPCALFCTKAQLRQPFYLAG